MTCTVLPLLSVLVTASNTQWSTFCLGDAEPIVTYFEIYLNDHNKIPLLFDLLDAAPYQVVAILDSNENVIMAGEAEQSNNDTLRAVPDDYDKMAACTPDEAIWLVPNRTVGHEVKRALCSRSTVLISTATTKRMGVQLPDGWESPATKIGIDGQAWRWPANSFELE